MNLQNRKYLILTESLIALVIAITAIVFISRPQDGASALSLEEELPIYEANMKYGFNLDSFHVVEGEIQKNQFLADILMPYDIPYVSIDKIVKKAKPIFDVRKLRAGKKYTILCSPDTAQTAQYFIYDPGPYNYVVYDFQDTMKVYKTEREVERKVRLATGIIRTSLWDAIVDNDLSWDVAVLMEEVYGWSVDFHHLQEGDRFKILYEEDYIEGQVVGVGKVTASVFDHRDSENYAFYYAKDSSGFGDHYYDEKARPMKKAFLKAPVKYTRISSRFSRRRFHPVLKRYKSHLGTDYAAPRGTPIYAVAAGTVSRKGYTRGNGNFVKIKHDKVYSTQYLHMSRFAKGMGVGVHVRQGQVIGYVGSTGLATGPHVCYRFWKNGKQVNPMREKLPPPEPMPEKYVADFNLKRDSLRNILDDLAYAEDNCPENRIFFSDSLSLEQIIP